MLAADHGLGRPLESTAMGEGAEGEVTVQLKGRLTAASADLSGKSWS